MRILTDKSVFTEKDEFTLQYPHLSITPPAEFRYPSTKLRTALKVTIFFCHPECFGLAEVYRRIIITSSLAESVVNFLGRIIGENIEVVPKELFLFLFHNFIIFVAILIRN